MTRIDISFAELVQLKKVVTLSEKAKEQIMKKHKAGSLCKSENNFTIYTNRFEYVYLPVAENIICCLKTSSNNMGAYGETKKIYYKV